MILSSAFSLCAAASAILCDSKAFTLYLLCLSDVYFQYTDMKEDMRVEAVDAVVSAIEKFGPSKGYDSAAKMVKELMDKKFSPSWSCFIGEGFGFDVDAEKYSMIYMYYGGAFGILLYKNPF
jgi:dynein light chain 4